MNIIGIEASSNYGSIALANDKTLICEHFYSSDEFKTEELTTYLKDMLNSIGLSLKNINGFVVSLGPGSYTALRIGLTTARTISQLLNKPLIGISTLEVIANQSLPLNGTLLVATKARQGILNIALFGLNGNIALRLTDDFTIDQNILIKNLSQVKGELFLSGEASLAIIKNIKKHNKYTNIKPVSELFYLPKASTLAYLGYNKIKNKDFHDSCLLKINYAFSPHVIISNKNDPNKKS